MSIQTVYIVILTNCTSITFRKCVITQKHNLGKFINSIDINYVCLVCCLHCIVGGAHIDAVHSLVGGGVSDPAQYGWHSSVCQWHCPACGHQGLLQQR